VTGTWWSSIFNPPVFAFPRQKHIGGYSASILLQSPQGARGPSTEANDNGQNSRICPCNRIHTDYTVFVLDGNLPGLFALKGLNKASGSTVKRILAYLVVLFLLNPYTLPVAGAVVEMLSDGSSYSCEMDCCGDQCNCPDHTRNGPKSQDCEHDCKQSFCPYCPTLAILYSDQLSLAFDYHPYVPLNSTEQLPYLLFPIDHPPKSSN